MSWPPNGTSLAPSVTWIWCNVVRLGVSIPLAHQSRQECLLHVQAVLPLVPYARLRAFDHVGADLLPPMGREAMQEDGFRVRELHQVPGHRVAPERVAPRLRLLLLPHRRPHIPVHHVRALHRVFGGLRDGEAGAPPRPPPRPRPPLAAP